MNKNAKTTATILIFLGIISLFLINSINSTDFQDTTDKTLFSSTTTSDTYRLPSGYFQTFFYPNVINLEYNNKFYKINEFLNSSTDKNSITWKTIDNKELKFEYFIKEKNKDKETLKDKVDKKELKTNINKDSFYVYYNITNEYNNLEEFGFILNTSEEVFFQDNYFIWNNLKFDFSQAVEVQGLTYEKNSSLKEIKFKGDKLDYIDPVITYNESSTPNVIITCNATTIDSAPLDDAGVGTDVTTDPDFDANDNANYYIIATDTGKYGWCKLSANISSILPQDITQLTFSTDTDSSSAALNLYHYIYNQLTSSWTYLVNWSQSTSDILTTSTINSNILSYNSSTGYIDFLIQTNTSSTSDAKLDYMYATVTYGDLVINSPTEGQEISSSYITLNTTHLIYNNTVWYTYNSGATNYTLCINSNDCQSTIFIPNGGSNTITVYANKSDGTVVSKSKSFSNYYKRTYKFNTTYENISIFAYSSTSASNPVPISGLSLVTATDESKNSALDTDDTSYVALNGNNETMLFKALIDDISSSDIYLLNWTWIGFLGTDYTNFILFYLWNDTTWGENVSSYKNSVQETRNLFVTNATNYINSSKYVHMFLGHVSGGIVNTDYVQLELSYDDLKINTPTSNQEILNTLSTTLNISSIGYTNTIWYSWNSGRSNNTLCTNAGECQATITFPRQGYYNLSVWGNKSDGTVVNKNVNNLFVGLSNISISSIDDLYWDADGNQPRASLIKFNITNFINGININRVTSNFFIYSTGGTVHPEINISRVSNQTWVGSSLNCTTLLALNQTNKSSTSLSSITSKTWTSFDITNIFNEDKQIGNNYTSLRFYNTLFPQGDTLCIGVHANEDLKIGRAGTPSQIFMNGTSYATGKPFLNITYYLNNNILIFTNNFINNSNFTGRNQTFIFNITDDNDYLTNISIFLDDSLNQTSFIGQTINTSTNNTFNFTINNIADGTHTYYIQAYDSDNAQSNSSVMTFTIDSNNPNATIIFPINGTKNVTLIQNFTANFTDNQNLSNYTLNIYKDGTIFNQTSGTISGTNQVVGIIVTLIDGIFDWFYNVFDWIGNSFTTNNSTVQIDSTAPSILIINPLDGGGYNSGTVDLNYTITDGIGVGLDSCWYRNNSNTNISITCGNSVTISQASEGTFTAEVCSNDTLGNTYCHSHVWTYGTLALTLFNPTSNQWFNYKNNIFFNFTATDSNGIDTCELWGNWTGSWHKNLTKTFSGDTSVDISEGFFNQTLEDGNYIFNIWCNDSISSEGFSALNRTFHIDTTFPQINLTSPLNTTYTSIPTTLNFTFFDLNVDKCWYFNGSTNSTPSTCNNFSITPNQGNNNFIVYINDSSNNLNSSSVSFFVDSILPAPRIIFPTSGLYLNYNTSINFNVSYIETNPNSYWYNINGSNITFNGANFTLNLTDESNYNFTFYMNDSLNNFNYTNVSFFVDTISPSVTINVISTTSGSNSLSFTNTISDFSLNTSSCKYSITNSTGNFDYLAGIYTENRTFICNNLITTSVSDYGTYNLTIYSKDLAGNENKDTKSFTTSASTGTPSPGGGGSPPSSPKVSVVGLIFYESFNGTYSSNLSSAIIYARVREYCINFSLTGECSLSEENMVKLLSDIRNQTVDIKRSELDEWISQYNDNRVFSFLIDETIASKYNLFISSVSASPIKFQVSPSRFDAIFFPIKSKVFSGQVRSNLPLASCEVISGDSNVKCEVISPTNGKITYTEVGDLDSFSHIVSATVSFTNTNGENSFVDFNLRVINSAVGLFVIIIFVPTVSFLGYRYRKKIGGFFKKVKNAEI